MFQKDDAVSGTMVAGKGGPKRLRAVLALTLDRRDVAVLRFALRQLSRRLPVAAGLLERLRGAA